jgi:hypothetical protein
MSIPLLSIVVVVYDMPHQAWNTLQSLTSDYQRNVSDDQYEMIIVENNSSRTIPHNKIEKLPKNFHYILRQENGISPAKAINEALKVCRGDHVGLLIDGARMLSPRVVEYALQGLKIRDAIVTVPGYYLTEYATQETAGEKILSHEEKLLAKSNWRTNGYRLFDQACFSNGNRHGIFHPIMESNALFFSKHLLEKHGGVDENFNLKGGGSLNLHLYRLLCSNTDSPLVVLHGEGNFHQYHGGTSTTNDRTRDLLVVDFKRQLDEYWPGGFKSVTREPYLLGSISAEAIPLLQQSLTNGSSRFSMFSSKQKDPWADDTTLGIKHGER